MQNKTKEVIRIGEDEKADCEDGELQGDFCGSYLSGSLVPAEIWGSYVCRFWPVGEKAICVMIEEWKSNDKA